MEGNAKLQASASAAEIAGPGLGGLLTEVAGAVGGLLIDAVTFIVSAACLLRLRTTPEPRAAAGERPGMLRQLAVDNEVVVPVNKTVHLLVTGADVIHSFMIPAFGVRIDAVPGRMNESWFRAEKEGVYYGQCSKLCGKDHANMPIMFRVVSDQAYTAWLNDAKKKFASRDVKTNFAALDLPTSTISAR